ncbi:hypothetical protein GALMADRAFT_248846 [Galerina marginata CBS 339.88]|uniref:Rho-GAP domain-containing protein n=1 Tax=Galerina marginata (strain CBS 339.88) TaxID=685588 RepID=A0A067T526_GALM3|nr:hypothetical protein GALMADRAFT_248846 [Galerina marginata CBS 339.88]
MGSTQSKPTPPLPSPSTPSSAAAKGINAAVAGGIKLKRAFAARRKKSEDGSSLLASVAASPKGKEPETRSPRVKNGGAASSTQVADRSIAPPPLALDSVPRSHPHRIDHTTTSSPPPISQVSNKSTLISPAQLSPPPPTPPKKDLPSSSPPSFTSTQFDVLSAGNRSSIMPISPGISSAVNYISMFDQQQNGAGSSSTSRQEPEKENLKSAPPPSNGDMKESWRKSDSANSHQTIRPGGGASSRTSRPVSFAESFQSAHTVVQPTGSRPMSANFGMLEEDDDGEESSSSSHENRQEADKSSPASSVRSKSKNRRSLTLNLALPSTSASKAAALPTPPSSASAAVTEMKHPSLSISEGLPPQKLKKARAPPVVSSSVSQPQPHPYPQSQSPSNANHPNNASTSNLRGRFAAWTGATGTPYISAPTSVVQGPPAPSSIYHPNSGQGQERNLPSLPPQHASFPQQQQFPPPLSTAPHSRTPAISMSSGLGPAAAGLAKRAAEKIGMGSMGRKWMGMGLSSSHSGRGEGSGTGTGTSSSGYSSSSSGSISGSMHTNAPSSFSSPDYALVRTSSNSSAQSHPHSLPQPHAHFFTGSPSKSISTGGKGHSHGHSTTFGTGSVSSSLTSSTDSDPFSMGSQDGPMLGRKLRGPLIAGARSIPGRSGGGLVFRKDLASGVRDTGLHVLAGGGGQATRKKGGLVTELEERRLPALVVRCAQHVLLWGVQEEGLFRVSGMPSHVSKLRAEFDSGVDYDMTECTPGDLDPHAVASVFKAYLRELPEPILTQKLQQYFDAAINKETTINAAEPSSPTRLAAVRSGGGLPSGPKSGFNNSMGMMGGGNMALRKPPSLSTLAMPSFTGIPPPSKALISAIRALIQQLPVENRDLVRTVVDLIKATAGASKETKMPLSNLLLVFCPSVNMTPPLLKVLCEADGIWVDEEKVIDIRRQTVVPAGAGDRAVDVPPPTPTKNRGVDMRKEKDEADTEAEEVSIISGRASLDTTDNSLDYHASAEDDASSSSMFGRQEDASRSRRRPPMESERAEVPTVYLSTRSHCSTASSVSSFAQQEKDESTYDGLGGGSSFHHSRDAALDDARSVSSGEYSVNNVPMSFLPPPPLSLSAESVATPASSSGSSSLVNLPASLGDDKGMERRKEDDYQHHQQAQIAETTPLELRPQPSMRGLVSSPTTPPTPVQFPSPYQQHPETPSAKRRSVPVLSLPNFSPSSFASRTSSPSPPTSARLGSPQSLGGGPEKAPRTKKPSLKLLFSKRSASSLKGARDRVGMGLSVISNPIPQGQDQGQTPQQAQYTTYRHSPRSASDSSVSTPLSAVTAPQSSLSGSGSTSHFPPVLDTPIEGPSLSLDLGFEVSPPTTAILTEMMETTSAAAAKEERDSKARAASNSINMSSTGQVATLRAVPGRTSAQKQLNLPVIQPLSIQHRTVSKAGEDHILRPQESSSNLSISSTASSHHLSLFEDDDDEEEDWTQSVLLAADVDGHWAVQKPAASGSTSTSDKL